MPEFNPRLLRRMLALRQFSMFANAELGELAMIAENLVETRYAPGAVVVPAAARVPAIHLVVDGRIEGGRAWGARQIFGALEVFAGREVATPAIAATETRTLHLSAADLADVLEDNFGVLVSVVRELAVGILAEAGAPGAPAPRVAVPGSGGALGLVERLIVLRQLVPFSGARLQGLTVLAHASEELSWAAGTTVARAGELAAGSLLVIDGALRVHGRESASDELGPGQVIGALETLAGTGHAATIEAVTPVRVLQSGGPAIFDLLEDHPDVGISMISTFARILLDRAHRGAAPVRGPSTGAS
jgi:CRP-like cAMP-binding protein